MKYLIAVITIFMCVKDIHSQTYEIGLTLEALTTLVT